MEGELPKCYRWSASRKVSVAEFERAKGLVMTYLANHPSITNRELRTLTGLNYDQAGSFFNSMIAAGHLVRVGKTTSIKYRAVGPHIAGLDYVAHASAIHVPLYISEGS